MLTSSWRNGLRATLSLVLSLSSLYCAPDARGSTNSATVTFSVTRNGDQIGTDRIDIERDGTRTTVTTTTHVEVKVMFLTVYRFDQTESEQWQSGRLVALKSITDDNGTLHKTSASQSGAGLLIDGDGKERKTGAGVVPASLWNESMLAQSQVLNPQDGTLVPIKVSDCGNEDLLVNGRAVRAHHYVIKTTFAQEVWYDDAQRLLRVELTGRDGSLIRYQPV